MKAKERRTQLMATQVSPERLAELRAMPYEEYLQTPEWQATRKRILKRDNSQCQGCHGRGITLNVHHYTYERLGCERDTDLVTLCEFCHEELHRRLADPPKIPFLHKCGIGAAAAVLGTIGIEGFLQAPLPAEIGVLIGAFLLARNSPMIYASLKEKLPEEVMTYLGQAPREKKPGQVSMLDAWLGRSPKQTQRPDTEEASDEDILAYLRETGASEDMIAAVLGEDEETASVPPDAPEQSTFDGELPQLSLFGTHASEHSISKETIGKIERHLDHTLKGFGVYARVLPSATMIGPRVIQFGIVPTGVPEMQDGKPKRDAAGHMTYSKRTRIEEITKREKDIQLALGAKSIRMLPPVPGKRYVGLEIPNPHPVMVHLTDVLSAPSYRHAKDSSRLVFALGRDVSGQVRFCDIAHAPHILIAGTTGGGKSMLLNVLIASLLTQATPEEVRLLMVDPKLVELTPYNGIAHLLYPVITDMSQVPQMLDEVIEGMEERYHIFSRLGVRHIESYHKRRMEMMEERELPNLPSIVIIIDEFADLMMTTTKEDDVEGKICRLAQKGRAAGMHLVIATQRPSVKVITGQIKANMPTAIALKTKAEVDSRIILDQGGAEKLLGNGDMLYLSPDTEEAVRIQGAYMTDADAEALTAFWRTDEPDEMELSLLGEDMQERRETEQLEEESPYPDEPETETQLPKQEVPLPTPIVQEKGPRAEDIDLAAAITLWNSGYNSDRELAKVFHMTKYQGNRLAGMIRNQVKKQSTDAVPD
jgi:FtsK/SpoIIIE family/FtsK alpha domain